jgi:hypothetical protein
MKSPLFDLPRAQGHWKKTGFWLEEFAAPYVLGTRGARTHPGLAERQPPLDPAAFRKVKAI